MVKNQNDFDTKGYVPIKSQMGGKKNKIKWVEWSSGDFWIIEDKWSSIFAQII